MLGKEYQEGWDNLKTFVYREYGIERREGSMELADVVLKMVEQLEKQLEGMILYTEEDSLHCVMQGWLGGLKAVAQTTKNITLKEAIDPSKLTAIDAPPDVQAMMQRAILRELEKRKNRVKEWEEQGQRDGVQFALCEGGASDGCVVEIPPTLSDGTNMVVGTQSYVFRGGKLRVWEE